MFPRLRPLSTLAVLAVVALLGPHAASASASAQDWPTVVRDGTWQLREAHTSGGATQSWNFGIATDVPVFGDWDGDGVATPGVYRDGNWYLSNSMSSGSTDIEFYYGGRADDHPVAGDWDGDGIDTVGVIRGGTWHLVNSFRGGAADTSFIYGRIPPRGDDVPLVGDWDGDGVDTVGIVRDGAWHLRNSNSGGPGELTFVYGRVGPRGDDIAGVGDWDGDGVDTVGVVRDTTWHLRNAHEGGTADVSFDFGAVGDRPIVQRNTPQQDPSEFSPRDAIRAWFPDVSEKAIAVADCESGLNPNAVNPRGFHGLYQISEQHHRAAFERVTGQTWEDGIYVSYYNAQYARHLYDGSGWSSWPHCGS